MPSELIIQARQVSKCFRVHQKPFDYLKELAGFPPRLPQETYWALQGVDIEVPRGRCLGIIGENGSGKSTLLGILAGITPPTSGEVHVNGRVSALLELGAGFNGEYTGRENIFLNAAILGFSDAETRRLLPGIERFAEIGEFLDRPVKTYSNGMFVRLAFAVAIHMDPDVLIVDEALAVGDVFFQQRCIRRIQELKQRGITIVFVSHDMEAVRVLADQTIWMDQGRVRFEGKADEAVSRYVGAMLTRGRADAIAGEIAGKPSLVTASLDIPEPAQERIPAFVTGIPNVDHRYGNGKARIAGIGVFSKYGHPVTSAAQGDRVCIRVSVEFLGDVRLPNVGFMLRNRLGQDVTGSNVLFEGERLAPAAAGDRISVDFVLDLPFLHSGFYSISPAVADGELSQYQMCDWIDNAFVLEVVQRAATYGCLRIPIKVKSQIVTESGAVTAADAMATAATDTGPPAIDQALPTAP